MMRFVHFLPYFTITSVLGGKFAPYDDFGGEIWRICCILSQYPGYTTAFDDNNITVANEDNSGAYCFSVSLEGDMSNNRIYDNTCTANFDETKTGNQQYSYAVQLLLNGGGSWAVEFEGNSFSAKYGQISIYWNGMQDVIFK